MRTPSIPSLSVGRKFSIGLPNEATSRGMRDVGPLANPAIAQVLDGTAFSARSIATRLEAYFSFHATNGGCVDPFN